MSQRHMIQLHVRRRRGRSAFTLIELVASAVLASLMMAGIFTIVWSALRESAQLQRTAVSQFPPTRLVEQIRIDLQNARGMLVDRTGLTLHGFVGRDPITQRPTLTPGRVRYET
ncbi:MAG: PulJ/GspJ family protein, partial [Rubripirellula sp.]